MEADYTKVTINDYERFLRSNSSPQAWLILELGPNNFLAWEKAFEKDIHQAIFLRGLYFEYIDKSEEIKPESLYQRAAELGNTAAMWKIGSFHINENNYDRAINDFNQLIQDTPSKTFYWYEKRAQTGNIDAIAILGHLYYDGIGVEENNDKAFELFSKAAKAGNVKGIVGLGSSHEFGHGTEKDMNKAFMYYSDAYKQGMEYLKLQLIYHRINGYGFKRNYKEAMKIFNH